MARNSTSIICQKNGITLYPKDTYTESTSDENEYENGIKKGVKATLPLNLPELYKKYGYNIIRNTPFGNSLTFDMAKAAIDGEQLVLMTRPIFWR